MVEEKLFPSEIGCSDTQKRSAINSGTELFKALKCSSKILESIQKPNREPGQGGNSAVKRFMFTSLDLCCSIIRVTVINSGRKHSSFYPVVD